MHHHPCAAQGAYLWSSRQEAGLSPGPFFTRFFGGIVLRPSLTQRVAVAIWEIWRAARVLRPSNSGILIHDRLAEGTEFAGNPRAHLVYNAIESGTPGMMA